MQSSARPRAKPGVRCHELHTLIASRCVRLLAVDDARHPRMGSCTSTHERRTYADAPTLILQRICCAQAQGTQQQC